MVKNLKILTICFFILLVACTITPRKKADIADNLTVREPGSEKSVPFSQRPLNQCVRRYSEIEDAGIMDKQILVSAIQTMASHAYRVGFRYIGIWGDFFHGHLIADRNQRPLGLLFHMQEQTRVIEERRLNGEKYLTTAELAAKEFEFNRKTRSWILWFAQPNMPVLAEKYMTDKAKNNPKGDFILYGSVGAEDLDADKIGITERLPYAQGMFSFFQIACKKSFDKESTYFEVTLPTQEKVCLNFIGTGCSQGSTCPECDPIQ